MDLWLVQAKKCAERRKTKRRRKKEEEGNEEVEKQFQDTKDTQDKQDWNYLNSLQRHQCHTIFAWFELAFVCSSLNQSKVHFFYIKAILSLNGGKN